MQTEYACFQIKTPGYFDMKALKLILSSMIIWLPLSSLCLAHSLTMDKWRSSVDHRHSLELSPVHDWLKAPVAGDWFVATGDIYMAKDYFTGAVSDGVTFKARGEVSFLPDSGAGDIPEFDVYSDKYRVASTGDCFHIDYWIGANSNVGVHHFFSLGNIYIVDKRPVAPVPLPPASFSFLSALSLIAWRRRSFSQ